MKMRTQFGWSKTFCRKLAVLFKKLFDFEAFSIAFSNSFSCDSEGFVSVSREVSSMKVKWYILILLAVRPDLGLVFSADGISAEVGWFTYPEGKRQFPLLDPLVRLRDFPDRFRQ